ncbi:type VI secretion system baseplate subunit TssF [Trinickia fusca]|uniref:Type VI secretion system baseplate subunit TssF n=1 Tax=Trinickia fusca TaxID=2419777 RepID=A0A494X4E3_9BURK|nr:type VI secretion system baseplate subunit TssF [Trinickia fusca]RKP44531.1 type VI secretion system baseplate subunit TssF [Trinickia fusca]
METRFLDYYNRELAYMRELGTEFAREFPKVAGRLGMHGIDVADPYVERLLEGFCFLTARVQLKMDAEFPRFSQRLLEIVYPNHLAPMPSMGVVQFHVDMRAGTLAQGFVVPAGTNLRGEARGNSPTPCEFRTAHEVTLWPLALLDARMTATPPDWPPPHAGRAARARGVLRIRLGAQGGIPLAQLPLERLVFHVTASEPHATRLLELVTAHCAGVACRDPADGRWLSWVDADAGAIAHEGFGADQAMLPFDARIFDGYRILHEYFAFPARYLFFSIAGLRKAIGAVRGSEVELVLPFDTHDAVLERNVDANSLALHCTPVVNLFDKRTDRIAVTPGSADYRLVVDRTRALDYEVYAVKRVIGHRVGAGGDCVFRPFYASMADDEADFGAYYSLRREPRLVPVHGASHGARQNTRSSYAGTDVYVSLVDRRHAPFDESIELLSADTLCTNRDLPLTMPLSGASDLTAKLSAPIERVKIVRGPTRPRPPLAHDQATWQLIGHLGLNYQALDGIDDEAAAHALREVLGIYADSADAATLAQIRAIRRLACAPIFERVPQPGPIVFGRGVRVSMTVDEQAFAGDSPYLLGAVLEQFFARHASINAFTKFALCSPQRGEIAVWPARIGRRPAL